MKFSPLGVSYGLTASMRLMLTRRGSGDHKNEVQPPGAVLWANGVDEADVDNVVGKGVGGPHWGGWAPCHHP